LCAEFDSIRQLFAIRLAVWERRFVLFLAPRLAVVTGAACNFRVNAALYGRLQ